MTNTQTRPMGLLYIYIYIYAAPLTPQTTSTDWQSYGSPNQVVSGIDYPNDGPRPFHRAPVAVEVRRGSSVMAAEEESPDNRGSGAHRFGGHKTHQLRRLEAVGGPFSPWLRPESHDLPLRPES